jgi:hypothetical protein
MRCTTPACGAHSSPNVSPKVIAAALAIVLVCLILSFAACGASHNTSGATSRQSPTPGVFGSAGGTGQHCAGTRALRSTVEAAVARTLGLSADALEANLRAGQTLVQIAQARHVPVADLNAAYLNAVRSGLATAVKNGQMTQTQADNVYAFEQQAVVSGHYPELESPTAGGGLSGTPPAGGIGGFPSGTPPAASGPGVPPSGTPPSGALCQ